MVEQAAREKTEKIINAELQKAAANPDLQVLHRLFLCLIHLVALDLLYYSTIAEILQELHFVAQIVILVTPYIGFRCNYGMHQKRALMCEHEMEMSMLVKM